MYLPCCCLRPEQEQQRCLCLAVSDFVCLFRIVTFANMSRENPGVCTSNMAEQFSQEQTKRLQDAPLLPQHLTEQKQSHESLGIRRLGRSQEIWVCFCIRAYSGLMCGEIIN